MKKVKVVIKKDGKMETVSIEDTIQEDLLTTRQEVKDMISGNSQFHEDPFNEIEKTDLFKLAN